MVGSLALLVSYSIMWDDRSQLFRTSSYFRNDQHILSNYSSQTTHSKLKQVFNITFTHYCSTSIHKKLQQKCKQSPKKNYKVGPNDRKLNNFMIAGSMKKEIHASSPLKLKFISLKPQQNKISRFQRDKKNKKTLIKISSSFQDKLQTSQIYSQQRFPLKATGQRVELQQKQDSKKQTRQAFYRPSTAYPYLLKPREMGRAKRLKTTCDKHLQDKQQNDMQLCVKGWQLTQRQY